MMFYLIVKFALNRNIDVDFKIFILSPLLSQVFIRGAGYFNGGFLFYLVIIIILSNLKKDKV
jgi:hypothetical protein